MKIYTRTGDHGETSLFSGQRVSKAHPRVAVYGTLDEVNSILGAAVSALPSTEVREALLALQIVIFDLCTDLATVHRPGQQPRISDADVLRLEQEMDILTEKLPPLRAFILPGGSPAAAQIHIARTITRRAEREAVSLSGPEEISRDPLVLLNRLSDYLFLLARRENQLTGATETEWVSS